MTASRHAWGSRLATSRGLIGLSLLFNLPLVVLRVHRAAFDTYTHIFLADHYRADWWSLWEPRWYLGFSTASYPPLVHQLIALLSRPLEAAVSAFAPGPEIVPGALRWVGEEAAYLVVLLGALGLFPLAVRACARVFVGPRAAGRGAMLAVCLPALALSGWAFGQLPTLLATGFMLLALARGAAFVRHDERWALAQAVLLAALAAATHHAVFLFVPFGGLAVAIQAARPWRWSHRKFAERITRAGVWALLSAAAVAAVLWPFLAWSLGRDLQTPIDHASRHNFISQPAATLFFFWPVYGTLLLVIPAALRQAGRLARLRPLAAAWAALFLLGLGGTTPLPRWLFGAAWEWLTYDRFGLWSATLLLPFAGVAWLKLERSGRRGHLALAGLAGTMVLSAGIAGWLSVIAHAQPPALDLAPLIRFLREPAQLPYRYLTLGFGDQFAKLAALAPNGTLDGAYHTARELPELRASGLGTLDGAVWNRLGVWALEPILREPGRYGLRWVFANHAAYEPVLIAAGWQFRFMVGEVAAWERADVTPLPNAPPAENRLAAGWWGAAPLGALIAAALALAWPRRRQISRARAISAAAFIRQGLWTVTVVLLSLWWATIVREGAGDLPRVYFFYRSVLIFASDAALVLTLAAWLIERGLRREALRAGPRPVALAGAAVIAAVLLSAAASTDRGLTLALALHLSALAGLYLMLVNDPPGARALGWLFGGIVLAQGALALVQMATQSTALPRDLYLWWPGRLTAETGGASVVMDGHGARWLRAYGTLVHPNVLGAMLLVCLAPVLERSLAAHGWLWSAPAAIGAGAVALTFSRAAWLGLVAMLIIWIALMPRAGRSRGLRTAASMGAAALITLMPLWSFVAGRVDAGGQANPLERASTLERSLLVDYGWRAWRAQPITGVGAGGFVQWAARAFPEREQFQPVHNLPLLIVAEAGLIGGAAALALFGVAAARVWRRRRALGPAEAAWAAALGAICVTAWFDHLWWTQPPARTLAVIALAVWAAHGQRQRPA